ncbi:hypothetical protein QYE76_030080 [Lolium multiflorum]|uniref:Transposase Tnp1/En/Spm-like domain-containing protein n=1 Tax=Lolium multiflorum TaxID=4521 RepID=A0AAD8VG57_LOLMU|nr:hypothetical protein QYE76_030080 [Lolium multiflorum]
MQILRLMAMIFWLEMIQMNQMGRGKEKMSKRGRDDMEATAKKYEDDRAARIRENKIKMQSLSVEAKKRALNVESGKKPLSIESILQGCGMKKPPNKVPKPTQPGLIIGRGSLRPRSASTLTQKENLVDQTAEKADLEMVDEDTEKGKVEKEVRKFTRKETLWARANEKLPLIKLDCNKLQQPIGPGSKEFPAVVTTLIRTKQFPVNLPDWRDVPVEHKEKLLDDLSAIYVMDEWLKTHSLLTAAKKWRAFKCDLKKKAFKSDDPLKTWTIDELLARGDIRVDPEQWKWLVKHWLSKEGQESSIRGKLSRSKVVTPHTTGSKSFARAGHEWGKELGHDLSRHELFIKTHTRKNGDPLDKAIPKMNALAEAATDHPELLERPIEKGDLFAHVFGREPRGYVRGVGLGPTPATLGIDGHRTCTSTRIQMARRHSQNMEEQNTLLRNVLQQVCEEMREIKETMKAGQRNGAADHVSTPTQEYGSDPSPPMLRGVANEYSDHDVSEDMTNNPIIEEMPMRGKLLLQPTRRHEEGGKEVVLLSVERPRDRPVAKATLQSTNPEARVGGSLLGCEYHEVVVNSVMRGDHILPRQHGKMKTLADCLGQSIAWPHLNIVNDEKAAKQSMVQRLQHGVH